LEPSYNFVAKMTEKAEGIGIESLFENIFDRLNHVAEVYVAHLPSASEVTKLHITVRTGEADSMKQYLDVTTADKVMIDIGDAEPLLLPFDAMATVDGPGHIQGIEGTTVYLADNARSAESRELEVGLSVLRQKLAGMCPCCDDEVDTLRDHYTGMSPCREEEWV
jgi:hypothetical protein